MKTAVSTFSVACHHMLGRNMTCSDHDKGARSKQAIVGHAVHREMCGHTQQRCCLQICKDYAVGMQVHSLARTMPSW